MTGQFTLSSRRLAILAALAVAFFAALAASSVGTQTASAGQPPICSEYPDLPQCEEGGGNGGENPNPPQEEPDDEGGAGGGPGAGPTGDAGGGELPFTGYPLTSLMLLLLILLATGLAIRSYLAVRDRLRSGHSPLQG